MRMACPAVQHFSTFHQYMARFSEKFIKQVYKVCFDFLYNFCLKYFSF